MKDARAKRLAATCHQALGKLAQAWQVIGPKTHGLVATPLHIRRSPRSAPLTFLKPIP